MTDYTNAFSWSRKLAPIKELNDSDIDYLFQEASVEKLEPRSLISRENTQMTYLLEGEVSLLAGGFVTETFTHMQQRALRPLFDESLDEDSAVFTSHGVVLQIDRKLFDGLYAQTSSATDKSSLSDLTESSEALFQNLLQVFMRKQLELPTRPEAAISIRKAINDPETGSQEIIQIAQTDPLLSARLIQVANSPLYRTWREIKTVRDAVRRLGIETTKNLCLSLSLKNLFTARSSMIRKYLQNLYQQSSAVASLAYVICRQQAPHLDPEQALLSGLLQELGQIPILKYIDKHPSLMQTVEQLEKTIEFLYVPVSTLLLNKWKFDEEFDAIIEQGKDWYRDTGEQADYVDVVIAAGLLYRKSIGSCPVDFLAEIAVINKLELLQHDEDGSYFLQQAREQAADMQNLLQAD